VGTAPEGLGVGFPTLGPGGEVLIYTAVRIANPADSEVRAIRLSSGEDVAIESTRGAGVARLVGSRYLAYFDRQGRLLVAPFDLDGLEITGPSVPVARGLETELTRGGGQYAASASVLVYESGMAGGSELLPVWVDRAGNVEPVDPGWTFDAGPDNRGFALSPDGSKVAVGRSPDGTANLDIWIKQLRPLGPFSMLTHDPGNECRPRWTPDSRSVTYSGRTETDYMNHDVFMKRADGVDSEAELLADEERAVVQALLSPDGQWLVMRLGDLMADREIVARHLASDSLVTSMTDPGSWQTAPALSPDGRWLAYASDETERSEIYVRSFPDLTASKQQVSPAGGMMPVWGRTGRELFFLNFAREMVAVEVPLDGDFQAAAQTTLFTLDPTLEVRQRDLYALYDVDTDDQRFLMLQDVRGSHSRQVMAAFNWLDEVKRAQEGRR
jgi:hypothetical protein